ncbi:hypothetical protein GCM10023149_03120 [Mucilaginibacter gynuensis]|uniref:Lycopene cyclase domain-containing protein n=1 Tax=Mucilaginibacter gynuensis TaxID=1302236 RepID=A0ABP8FQG4_9SPHI
MSVQKMNARNTVLILMILGAAAMRFVTYQVPFLSNFTPVGAIALFGGTYFTDKWKAYLVPLTTLFISDTVINYLYSSRLEIDYSYSFWVYLSFAIMVFIGTLIKKASVVNVSLASLASVIVFWLLTDLPWLIPGMYPNTLGGYATSLYNAIPFQRNMLLGDFVFGAILYGGFEIAKSKFEYLRSPRELAL